ncbi:hypothetical protein EUX98_g1217 [Antrodiella citrinella]|uniref:SGNH hydrolase-type esterase domain-containing protein n=1 Tax=Antrodiella citrinella TaxID=2447956 RepID=A0A4S4N258_9APHY|nr:hypothetical protein EUX98_g1217 [Antrodiella citrinella]
MAATVHDVFLLFGDSVTEQSSDAGGLGQLLSAAYTRKVDVLNRGFSGYNTRWAIPILEQLLAKKTEQSHVPGVRLLIIWFGANDATIPANFQHVPLAEFADNLSTLVQLVTDPSSPYHSPQTKIVLITPPPVNTLQWGAYKASQEPPEELERSLDLTKTYAEKVKEVGLKEGVQVLDAWTALWKAAGEVEGNLSRLSHDGLHLNADGYKVVYDELMKIIVDKHPELHYNKLQDVFIGFLDIDPVNYRQGLQKRQA